jgi:UDP-GlcNAc3NAcA epimerase
MKIISIIGARPQLIKYAPLSKVLRRECKDVLIHTGQHYDYNMNKIFFDELNIPEPDYYLGVGSGTHAYQTGEMLKGIESVLLKEKPIIVIVFGDTNSTLSGALAAAKLGIKVAHVEAGLRSFDKSMPEEINRRITDHCSDLLFCPTRKAVENLRQEGVIDGVYLTGDVMVDALNLNKDIAEKTNILDSLGVSSKQYLLVTVHRGGNTDVRQNLESIANVLIKLGELGETVVFPVHPRTMKQLKTYGLSDRLKKTVMLIEPQGYFEFIKLLNHAKAVLTDSGGIQKEAYILRVPCITLRQNTEWIETVEDGWNVLVGVDTEKTIDLARNIKPGNQYSDVFGKGASERISNILIGH